MGCHTWFSIPYVKGKEEIKRIAQEYIDTSKYVSADFQKMYQFAINQELEEPVCELATITSETNHFENWILYKDITTYSVEKYNKEHGTDVTRYSYGDLPIESYSDEPRIGGYPENVIKSYDEMVQFMKDGYTNEEGKHYDFYYDKDRIDNVMLGIKRFFENHPEGIITFG